MFVRCVYPGSRFDSKTVEWISVGVRLSRKSFDNNSRCGTKAASTCCVLSLGSLVVKYLLLFLFWMSFLLCVFAGFGPLDTSLFLCFYALLFAFVCFLIAALCLVSKFPVTFFPALISAICLSFPAFTTETKRTAALTTLNFNEFYFFPPALQLTGKWCKK